MYALRGPEGRLPARRARAVMGCRAAALLIHYPVRAILRSLGDLFFYL